MDNFEKMEKRLLELPRQPLRTPDFAQISFKIQVARLQQKARRQSLALAAAFALSTLAIIVSVELALRTAPAAVMTATNAESNNNTSTVTAVAVASEAKSGENLESSGFEISWGKSDEIKNLAQAVNSAQWQIDTFNPITLQE